jgi:enamine deaminase RidA (YjgF/YER057c/UK114 family)
MTPEEKLESLGVKLPPVPAPVANYVPYRIAGGLVFISGQLPVRAGEVSCKGVVGAGVSVEEAREAAKLCAINILAAVKAAAGSLSEVEAVRLEGFVASSADFTGQPAVINGASDFMVEVLGDRGKHARVAVGLAALPLGAAVEISAVFRIL